MSEVKYRTYEDALADPTTVPELRLRIQADLFGDALFAGLIKHAGKHGQPDPLDDWYELPAFERSWWRAAVYEMLAAMKVPPL